MKMIVILLLVIGANACTAPAPIPPSVQAVAVPVSPPEMTESRPGEYADRNAGQPPLPPMN